MRQRTFRTLQLLHPSTHIAVVLAVVVIATVGGCSNSERTSPRFVDAPTMQDEYRAEAARLEWPAGVVYPSAAVEGEEDVEYEVGVGAASADFNWMCAWIQDWLASHTAPDSSSSDRALDMLDGAVELPVWAMWDANGHDALRNAVEAARRGANEEMDLLHAGLGCETLLGPFTGQGGPGTLVARSVAFNTGAAAHGPSAVHGGHTA